MDAVSTHLAEIGTKDWLIVDRIEVTDQRATMCYLDGNGRELALQAIPYTNFPLSNRTVYATWNI